jgi:predicted nucleotidyltransferase
MKISENHLKQISGFCKESNVKSFAAFGSVVRDDFKEDSDIDFLVDFEEKDPIKYTDLYFKLKENLEKPLKNPVDLIEERAVKNPYFRKELNKTKVLIYGQ